MHPLLSDDSRNTTASVKVFQWWDYLLFITLTCVKLSATLYILWYWFAAKDWLHYPVVFSIMTSMLLVTVCNNLARWFTLPYMRYPRPPTIQPGWKVAVITAFVPAAEPLEMLEDTVQALIALDYPHDTWVLDEGDDAQVQALCHRLGSYHFSRKSLLHYQTASGPYQAHSKHGNYNAWLYELGFDRYDIITGFDVDHVPEPAFLTNVLGYFSDPQVGYVQVAQAYYNQQTSFIACGAAEETYAYYSSFQMASYGMSVASVHAIPAYYQMPQLIGCHHTHRVEALKQIGGFAPHDADDLLATIFYWSHGWRGIYVPHILARGTAPVDWHGYLTQQRRWARAILDIKFRSSPLLPHPLSLQNRFIGFLHGLSYVYKSLLILISLILLACMLATGKVPTVLSYPGVLHGALFCVVWQGCEWYRQRFYLNGRCERGLHWRAGILQFAKWPFMLLALVDVILKRPFLYIITRKVALKRPHRMLLLPNMLVILVIVLCSILGMIYGNSQTIVLHIIGSMAILGSLALILSECFNFPSPYEKTLRNKSLQKN